MLEKKNRKKKIERIQIEIVKGHIQSLETVKNKKWSRKNRRCVAAKNINSRMSWIYAVMAKNATVQLKRMNGTGHLNPQRNYLFDLKIAILEQI